MFSNFVGCYSFGCKKWPHFCVLALVKGISLTSEYAGNYMSNNILKLDTHLVCKILLFITPIIIVPIAILILAVIVIVVCRKLLIINGKFWLVSPWGGGLPFVYISPNCAIIYCNYCIILSFVLARTALACCSSSILIILWRRPLAIIFVLVLSSFKRVSVFTLLPLYVSLPSGILFVSVAPMLKILLIMAW